MAQSTASSPLPDECGLEELQELLELERCQSAGDTGDTGDTSDQSGSELPSSGKSGKTKPSYKHIPHSQKPAHLVAKRNARERRRVQAVNQAFYTLRRCVPIENRNKRVSKVKTLQRAIDYIRRLERVLASEEDSQLELLGAEQLQAQQRATGRRGRKAAATSTPAGAAANGNNCDPAAQQQSTGRARRPRQRQQPQQEQQQLQQQPQPQPQQQQPPPQQIPETLASADCQLAGAGYAQACEQPLYSCPMDTCAPYDPSGIYPSGQSAYYGGADVAPAGQLHYLAPASNCYEHPQHQTHHGLHQSHQHHQAQQQQQQTGYLSMANGYHQPASAFYATAGCAGAKLAVAYAGQQAADAVYARPGGPSERLVGWSGSLQSPSSSTVSSSSSGSSCAGAAGAPAAASVSSPPGQANGGYLAYASGPFERAGQFAHLAPAKSRNLPAEAELPLANLAAGEQFNNQQTSSQMLGQQRRLYHLQQHQLSLKQSPPASPSSTSSPSMSFVGHANHHHLNNANLTHLSAARSANNLVQAQPIQEYATATQH